MPRVHWLDVPRTGDHRMLVGTIPVEADQPAISPALRSVCNQLARVCANLKLDGRYAIEGSRADGLAVRLAFERSGDADRFADAAGLPHPHDPQQASFVMDGKINRKLDAVAGPPDTRGSDRRARERDERNGRALAWAQTPFAVSRRTQDGHN